jgi:hypothetical protein
MFAATFLFSAPLFRAVRSVKRAEIEALTREYHGLVAKGTPTCGSDAGTHRQLQSATAAAAVAPG